MEKNGYDFNSLQWYMISVFIQQLCASSAHKLTKWNWNVKWNLQVNSNELVRVTWTKIMPSSLYANKQCVGKGGSCTP